MNTKELRISREFIPDVAPAIIRFSNGTHHNGILYRNADDKVFITHFAWDSDLRNDEYQGNYYYADMKITKSEAKWIAAFVGEVASADDNARIPYMIVDDPDVIFDSNGKWRPIDDFSGLTCATYVMIVFRCANSPLADTSTWPIRNEDDVAQSTLVRRLAQDASTAHLAQYQQDKIGKCPRVRPEEVVGAALNSTLPASFQEAEKNGEWVITVISASPI